MALQTALLKDATACVQDHMLLWKNGAYLIRGHDNRACGRGPRRPRPHPREKPPDPAVRMNRAQRRADAAAGAAAATSCVTSCCQLRPRLHYIQRGGDCRRDGARCAAGHQIGDDDLPPGGWLPRCCLNATAAAIAAAAAAAGLLPAVLRGRQHRRADGLQQLPVQGGERHIPRQCRTNAWYRSHNRCFSQTIDM